MKLPPHFNLQFTRSEITQTIGNMAKEITAWGKKVNEQSGNDLLAIPVLRGGLFFFAHLLPDVDVPVEIHTAQSKANQTQPSNVPLSEVLLSIDGTECAGRSVLVVDDICDSGRTLAALVAQLAKHGASEVKTAVLIHRTSKSTVCQPDWIGFEYHGPEWFVGFGMDENNRWATMPDIYVIRK